MLRAKRQHIHPPVAHFRLGLFDYSVSQAAEIVVMRAGGSDLLIDEIELAQDPRLQQCEIMLELYLQIVECAAEFRFGCPALLEFLP